MMRLLLSLCVVAAVASANPAGRSGGYADRVCPEDSEGRGIACTREYRPVCGSDGRTYGNECTRFAAHCDAQKKGQSVTKLYDGECQEEPETQKRCPEGGPACTRECPCDFRDPETSRPPRSCPDASSGGSIMCSANYSPVCGSDGKTYSNDCQLFASNCHAQKRGVQSVTKASEGECPPMTPRPQPTTSRPQRGCPDPSSNKRVACTKEWNPLCGSDGKTYSNKCTLFAAHCEAQKRGQSVTKVSNGACKAAAAAAATRLQRSCPDASSGSSVVCAANYSPVCGSDGITYSNECTLSASSCSTATRGQPLRMLHAGECTGVSRFKAFLTKLFPKWQLD